MINGSSILVTGGCGFIGSHLVEELINKGAKRVIIIDNLSTGSLSNISKIDQDRVRFIQADIEDPLVWQEDFEVEVIFHLAALVSVPLSFEKPNINNQINVTGFLNMLEYARLKKVKKVIYASSSAVYGDTKLLPIKESQGLNQTSPYGFSKYLNELYAQKYFNWFGLKSIGFRFFNVYGPRQDPSSPYSGVISIFIDKLLQKSSVSIYGNGGQTRDFIFVKDIVNGLILAYSSEVDNAVFNLGTGHSTTINVLFDLLSEILDNEQKPLYKLKRQGDIEDSVADISKASTEIGFKPMYDLKEGLQDTVDYFKSI